MIRRLRGTHRGGMSTQTLFLAGGAILVLAALVAWWTMRSAEVKKREHVGRVGLQSTFKLSRHAGVNLPIGDQARPGTATA